MGFSFSKPNLPRSCAAFRWLLCCFALAGILLGTGCGSTDPLPTESHPTETSALDNIQISPSTPLHLLNVSGQEINPFAAPDAKWVLFVFVSVDCPISNRYAPEVRRLDAKFSARGVKFWLVHPNVDESVEAIRKHTEEYQYSCGVLRDPEHLLVKHAQVHVTPEAALFDHAGRLLYRGRLDNRLVEFGKERPA